MIYDLLHMFSELVTAAAGVTIGLSALIIALYWKIFRAAKNGQRLLPIHVMLIGTSYSMLAFIAIAVMGTPPRPGTSESWWVYPFGTLAFVLGDIALLIILRFIGRRGPRYRTHNERRM